MKKTAFLIGCFVYTLPAVGADLFYLEAQGVGGYSSREKKAVFHSAGKHDAMQKNSLGFDWVHKFSNATGDYATFALQARLAYNDEAHHELTPQVYNAYLKLKTSAGDVWAGHNRVAFGLASYWDTHADLMGDLTMQGVSFDRDWGVGYALDTENGAVAASLTTGTGMNVRLNGNYLAAGRASFGVLNRDNYTVGVSVMGGETLETMGYKIMDSTPLKTFLTGIDGAWNINNFEHKVEADIGSYNHKPYYAGLYRFSVGLDSEDRLKLDIQPTYVKRLQKEEKTIAFGGSYLLTGDITLRLMWAHETKTNDNRYMAQLYWTAPW